MKKIALILLCSSVFNFCYSQAQFRFEDYEVDAKTKIILKSNYKKSNTYKFNPQLLKNFIRKSKNNNQKPISFYIELNGENIKFNLFEKDLLDDKYEIIKEGKKYTKSQIEIDTFDGFTGENVDDYLNLVITDDWFSGKFKHNNNEYVIENYTLNNLSDNEGKNKNTIFISDVEDLVSNLNEGYCGNNIKYQKKAKVANVVYPGYSVPCNVSSLPTCKFLKMVICCDSKFLEGQSVSNRSLAIINYINNVDRIYNTPNALKLRIKLVSPPIIYNSSSPDPFGSYPGALNSTPTGIVNIGAQMNNYSSKRIQVFGSNDEKTIHYYLSGKAYNGLSANATITPQFGQASETYFLGRPNFVSQAISTDTKLVGSSFVKLSNSDTYTIIAHEIGHLIGANHPTDLNQSCSTKTIMCEGEGKSEYFSTINLNEIACFFNTFSGGLNNIVGSTYFNNNLGVKMNGNLINSTPVLINQQPKILDLVVDSPFLNSSTYASNDNRVFFYYKNLFSTKFEIKTAPNFTMNITATNECFNYLRNIVFVYSPSGAKLGTSIYPNPASSELNLTENMDEVKINKIEIYNENGLINNNFDFTNETKVNISQLKNGKYFIKIFKSDFSIETKQLIIEK